MVKREATHAGSWYLNDGQKLSEQLDGWLDEVSNDIPDVGELPQPFARAIIAPWVPAVIFTAKR